jgi:hypothetical protein
VAFYPSSGGHKSTASQARLTILYSTGTCNGISSLSARAVGVSTRVMGRKRTRAATLLYVTHSRVAVRLHKVGTIAHIDRYSCAKRARSGRAGTTEMMDRARLMPLTDEGYFAISPQGSASRSLGWCALTILFSQASLATDRPCRRHAPPPQRGCLPTCVASSGPYRGDI